MELYCTYCGKKNEEDALFCSGCGKAIAATNGKERNSNTSFKFAFSKEIIVIVGILVGLFFGGAIGFSLAPESTGRGEKPSVINLLKGSYYSIDDRELIQFTDTNSRIATALRKGRKYLYSFSLLGGCVGGVVGYSLQRRKN